jgi:phosphoribosylformylglycinamidine synthase PurS subunit
MWLARIHVTLKPVVNDPQGLSILGGLRHLGFDAVRSVRTGKVIDVSLDVASREGAEDQVKAMCQKLLANPVIEDFTFDLEERAAPASASASR